MGAGRMGEGEFLHGETTKAILGAAFEVHGVLGPGFLESVYEEAIAHELHRRGMPYRRQVDIPIDYKGIVAGTHRLDLLADGKVIVEMKAVKELTEVHTSILLSYLSATRLSVGLLLNFARPSLEYRRVSRRSR